jgi:phage shock protein PspC (stress-responsive transcriptional regulator)
MNKVVNIQLAGQIFTLDEDAFAVLTNYLNKIEAQLIGNEDAKEIQTDIELRLAELLYTVITKTNQNVTKNHVEMFIEQIGFLDLDTDENERMQVNSVNEYKILAAVCFELSRRSRIPAFILRLLFLAGIFAAGLGIVLYVILYFSLTIRQSPKTAKDIEGDKKSILAQRILFFPLYLFGLLFSFIKCFFKSNQRVLKQIFKVIISIPLLILVILFFVSLDQMATYQLLNTASQFLFNIAAALLFLSFVWYLVNKIFIMRKLKLFSKELVYVLKACTLYICVVTAYLIYSTSSSTYKETKSVYSAKFSKVNIILQEMNKENDALAVQYYISPRANLDSTMTVYIEYESAGKSRLNADENLETIHFALTMDDSTLTLPSHFSLDDRALYRGQAIRVKIYVPNNLQIQSNLTITKPSWLNNQLYYFSHRTVDAEKQYIFQKNILFNQQQEFKNRLSADEQNELIRQFAKSIFNTGVASYQYLNYFKMDRYKDDFNTYLKSGFTDSFKDVYRIRTILAQENAVDLKLINELLRLAKKLENEHPNLETVRNYIEAVQKSKLAQN